jgi:hypothetical protein
MAWIADCFCSDPNYVALPSYGCRFGVNRSLAPLLIVLVIVLVIDPQDYRKTIPRIFKKASVELDCEHDDENEHDYAEADQGVTKKVN